VIVILSAILYPELHDPELGVSLEGARRSMLVKHLHKLAPGQVKQKNKTKTTKTHSEVTIPFQLSDTTAKYPAIFPL
jgi:hypothetical protein